MDLHLGHAVLGRALDDGGAAPDRLLVGYAGGLGELVEERLFLRFRFRPPAHFRVRLGGFFQGDRLLQIQGGRQQVIEVHRFSPRRNGSPGSDSQATLRFRLPAALILLKSAGPPWSGLRGPTCENLSHYLALSSKRAYDPSRATG